MGTASIPQGASIPAFVQEHEYTVLGHVTTSSPSFLRLFTPQLHERSWSRRGRECCTPFQIEFHSTFQYISFLAQHQKLNETLWCHFRNTERQPDCLWLTFSQVSCAFVSRNVCVKFAVTFLCECSKSGHDRSHVEVTSSLLSYEINKA